MSTQSVGFLMIVMGLILFFGHGLPFLGRLPGDFSLQRGGLTVSIPLGTCLVLSIVLSIVLKVLRRF